MATVSLRGITIGYEDEGTGPPLVLVHGHPFDRSMWRPQIEHFSRAGWRVIAPDLRGYGRSTVVPGTTTLTIFAGDVAMLMDHLGVERFVLGGLSMGGQIVMEFFRWFRSRVRGLVLADTFAEAETPAGKAARRAAADRLIREGMGPYTDEVLAKMVAPHNIEQLPEVAAHVRAMMLGTPPDGAAAALRGRAERPDYLELLTTVRVPALVVVGSADEFTPVRDAMQMHNLIPDSTLEVVHGAAHMPNLERAAEFNAVLAEFLGRVSTTDFEPSRPSR